MTNEQILKKAIEKAEKNGYVCAAGNWALTVDRYGEESILFDHDFCKGILGRL